MNITLTREGSQWVAAYAPGYKSASGKTPTMALLNYLNEVSCQCSNCTLDGPHEMDCSVHNEPAFPNGPCDCDAPKGKQEPK